MSSNTEHRAGEPFERYFQDQRQKEMGWKRASVLLLEAQRLGYDREKLLGSGGNANTESKKQARTFFKAMATILGHYGKRVASDLPGPNREFVLQLKDQNDQVVEKITIQSLSSRGYRLITEQSMEHNRREMTLKETGIFLDDDRVVDDTLEHVTSAFLQYIETL